MLAESTRQVPGVALSSHSHLGINIFDACMATCPEMIPVISLPFVGLLAMLLTSATVADAPSRVPAPPAANCLPSGDGYLRAHVAGAIDATIDWPNSGTRCQGESKSVPPGIRLSFQRASGANPNLLFVFGLTGIREGQPAHATGVNLTVILQGTEHIFGTLGDSRCTVDSLTQKPVPPHGSYRVEARGFCTQPAHEVRGDGDLLVSTFEFAGLVNYAVEAIAQPPLTDAAPR